MSQTIHGPQPSAEQAAKSLPPAGASPRPRARGRLTLLALLALALPAAGCFESKVVTSKVNPITPGAKEMNGVFYALPRTVVKVDVPVKKASKQPGAYSDFTPCFFPGQDYVVRKGNEFAVDREGVSFETMFVPDTEEIYMIKIKGGMFETRNLEMTLTETGVLVKASAEVTDDTIDIVTGTIEKGAGVLAKALPVFLSTGTDAELTADQKKCRSAAVDAWVEELELAGKGIIDAAGNIDETNLGAVPEIPAVLKDTRMFKAAHVKAKDIQRKIEELELRRKSVVVQDDSTKPEVRAETLKLVLDELDKSIAELKKNYFFGSESALTWKASFKLNPGRAKMNIDLFALSKDYGVCDVYVNQGTRLDPKFRIKKRCPNGAATCKPSELQPVTCSGQKVKLEMALGEDGEGGPGGGLMADVVGGKNLKQDGNRGFYYRIPGRAIAFLKQDQKEGGPQELARASLSVAQFGQVVSLPASTGGRRTKYTLDLFESSGGLKNFSMGSSALVQQKNIDNLAGAANTLIEAKGERNKAKAPADELQQLERERKILEERKKIRDLENDLNGTDDGGDEESP